MKNKIILLVLIASSFLIVNGQSALVTTGGDLTGFGGTISSTVGQVAFKYYTALKGSASEGVQQSYEISVFTDANKLGNELNLRAFPNPTSNNLTLEVSGIYFDSFNGNISQNQLLYSLTNATGQVIKKQTISSKSTIIELRNQPAGAYFVAVTEKQKNGINALKTFKIIKK